MNVVWSMLSERRVVVAPDENHVAFVRFRTAHPFCCSRFAL